MQQKSNFLGNLLLVVAFSCMLATVWSVGVCNRCMDNSIACVNQTHFKFCVNYSPIEESTLYCGDGKVCTELGILCADASLGANPVCKDDDINCNKCDGTSMFQCTSRTTFRVCNNNEFTGVNLTCPKDTVCSIKSGKFCVKECELPNGKYECNKAAP
ncbi:uncharacterized protein LOC117787769 [Drosophila innubila]|uniref:uncharacterized protein LOC117787769 n=1 Tax=Drosophila innubila TaxID=198719 RepID=UPI00148D3B4C|nr:uncharacterized protein LOC117787769 [Drosophila innubila]